MIEFLYNGNKCYASNLPKKLKRMKITMDDIQILREFDETQKQEKKEEETEIKIVYNLYQNSKGYYLYGINCDISYYNKQFGFDISDYKFVGAFTEKELPSDYNKWNPETKTGRKDKV